MENDINKDINLMFMIIIQDKFVKRYIPQEYIGQHPGIFACLFNTASYRRYMERVSEVSRDLSQFSSGAELVPYLVGNYGLSPREARVFVNKNVTYNWRKGDSVDKKCMLIHADRDMGRASKDLERCLDTLREE